MAAAAILNFQTQNSRRLRCICEIWVQTETEHVTKIDTGSKFKMAASAILINSISLIALEQYWTLSYIKLYILL